MAQRSERHEDASHPHDRAHDRAPDRSRGHRGVGGSTVDPVLGDLTSLGLDARAEDLYRVVLRYSGETLGVLSDRTGVPEPDLPRRLRPLVDLRLVRQRADVVHAEPPDLALGRLVSDRSRALQREEDLLAAARAAIPEFVAAHDHADSRVGEDRSVEVIESGDLVPVMESLVGNSTGELLFLRPDQYSLPSGHQMDDIMLSALRQGRRSRSMYPSAIADDVPERVRARAAAGERVRVVPEIPSRMAIFGDVAIVITEQWGNPASRRLVVRQSAVVTAMTVLFEAYWERGVSVPGLGVEPDVPTAELVELLARGAKDEQVARLLGVSLRTVRRRVAALMAELGVESRFQAGMEAVRRGLL